MAPSLRGLPNFLVYRIKRVHFDMIMKPSSIFFYRHRECCTEIAYVKMTHAEYLSQFYRTIVTLEHQPLLEAYPEKASECVFLLPEFCYPASVTEGMRRDAGVLRETLQQIEASPQERHNAILRQVRRIESACSETLDSWGCRLHSPVKTMEVIARPPAGGRKLCPQLQVWRSVSCNGNDQEVAALLPAVRRTCVAALGEILAGRCMTLRGMLMAVLWRSQCKSATTLSTRTCALQSSPMPMRVPNW